MKAALWYVVVRKSVNGEFVAGDRIMMRSDGSIVCRDTPGWMRSEDVPEATRGMEIKLDLDWIKKRRAKLASELASLRAAEKDGEVVESFPFGFRRQAAAGGKKKKAAFR